ncbi:MAG TPA: M4 family metallopeptidase [Ramlibacter sp.]|nr:M4 family metallopeptidase [Ramlibacter sp.]
MRLRCACCALPRQLLEHVAAKTGDTHAAQRQHQTSQRIRAQRHKAALASQKAPPGEHKRWVYDAGAKEHLPGRLVRAEGAAPAGDKAVNEAYDNVGITLEFFSKVFGRDSLDGQGMDVKASVHYGDAYANAMWNGEQLLFGDGDGIHIGGFTRALDIVAHELTHAVTQHSIEGGLGVVQRHGKPDLAGEPGALNESISDVFASLVKQWHARQEVTHADWLVGQGILAPAIGHAVRSLEDPGNPAKTYEGDHQVAHMSQFAHGGDVHANSGIPNHAFYLCAHALGGHAWEHAGRIWYEAVGQLHSKSTFADAAKATSETAARLFGRASKEQHAVQSAWAKVGVPAA